MSRLPPACLVGASIAIAACAPWDPGPEPSIDSTHARVPIPTATLIATPTVEPTPTAEPTPILGMAQVSVFEKYRAECVPDGLTLVSSFEGTLIDSAPLSATGTQFMTVAEGGEVSAVLSTTHAVTIGGVAPGAEIRIPWLMYWTASETCVAPSSVSVTITGNGLAEYVAVYVGAACGTGVPSGASQGTVSVAPYCTKADGSFSIFATSPSYYGAMTSVGVGTTSVALALVPKDLDIVSADSTVPADWLPFGAEGDIIPLREGHPIAEFSRVSTVSAQADPAYSVDHQVTLSEADALRYVQRFAKSEPIFKIVELRETVAVGSSVDFAQADWDDACDPGAATIDIDSLSWENACEDVDIVVLGVVGAWAGFYPPGGTSVRQPLLPGFDWSGRTVRAGVIHTEPSVSATAAGELFDLRHHPDVRVLKSYRGLLTLEY